MFRARRRKNTILENRGGKISRSTLLLFFFFLFAGDALYKNISPCDAFYFSPTVFLAFLCGVMALSVQTPVNLSVSESVSHNEGGERNHDDDAAIPRPPVPSHAHKISRLLCCQPDDSVS